MHLDISVSALIGVMLSHFFAKANCVLFVTPRDTEAMVNQSTYLNCSTSFQSQDVAWFHYRAGDSSRRYPVYDGTTARNYMNRFHIEGDRTKGVFNLIIDVVLPGDAGKYECQEEGGIGLTSSAELIVLEDALNCQSDMRPDGVIGPNDCGLEPEKTTLSCSVRFSGNLSPVLEWRSYRDNTTTSFGNSDCKSSGDQIQCNLTTPTDLLMNSTSYICRTTRATTSEQFNCSVNDFRIIYAFNNDLSAEKNVGDEIACSANSSQLCNYRWKRFEGSASVTVSTQPTLRANYPGWYRCEADCQLGSTMCTVTSFVVHVPSPLLPYATFAFAFAVVIVILLLVILILVGLLLRKGSGKCNASVKGETTEDEQNRQEMLLHQNQEACPSLEAKLEHRTQSGDKERELSETQDRKSHNWEKERYVSQNADHGT